MGAGRMAQHPQPFRIAAIGCGDIRRLGRGDGGVFDEGGKDHLGHDAVIGQGHDEPLGGQGLGRPAIEVARP